MKANFVGARINCDYCYMIIMTVLLALLPLSGRSTTAFMTLVLVYTISGLAWGFLAEYAGIVSLGQQLFIGLGMYGLIIFGKLGLSLAPAVALTALLNVALAAALAPPIFKLRGVYLAIGTWILASIFEVSFAYWQYVGAATGATYLPALIIGQRTVYYLLLALEVGVSLILYHLYNSKLGLGIKATGANEAVARERGVNVPLVKLIVFMISAVISSLVGSLYLLYTAYVTPEMAFTVSWIIALIFVNLIGGRGRIFGALLGSIIFTAVVYATSGIAGFSLLIEGLIVLAAWFLIYNGIWPLIARKIKVRPPL